MKRCAEPCPRSEAVRARSVQAGGRIAWTKRAARPSKRAHPLPIGGFSALFLLVLSGVLLPLRPVRALAAQERVEALDTNKDGKPDEWRYYDGQTLVRIERDRNHDGKPEIRIFMKDGKPERTEVDRNGDGKPDLLLFSKDGKPERQQADLNFDGKPDAWVFFKDGVKDLMIMDKNFDGQPDAWFYYGQGGTKLIGGRVDQDFDGQPDKTFGSVPKEEKRKPW